MQSFSRGFLLFGLFGLISLACYGVFAWRKDVPSNPKPHIIFILSDDMGWNDVSFHGANQIPTPNIDALAYNGVILNRHYVLPICTPSRSALLTGRYPIREGLQGFPLAAGMQEGMPLNRTLMPEYFRRLGYGTHLVGKWHVGYYTKNHTPAHRGFDTFYGYYNGFISYYNHTLKQDTGNNNYTVRGQDFHHDTPEHLRVHTEAGYFTDLITNHAVDIIKNHGNDKPLFLEIAHLAVHAGDDAEPLEVRDSVDNEKTFSYINNEERRKYAGMMKAMDESVGKVVAALGEAKMLDNSIIVFVADNGAPTIGLYSNAGSNYPLRGMKDTLYEGGVRGAACVFSPLIKSRSRVSEQTMHITDWLPTLYFAAGGNLTELRELDGLNQWPSILDDDVKSPRVSTLLNIDEIRNFEGALMGRFKLVKGATDTCEKCYGESGNDPSSPEYRTEDALSSAAGVAISQLEGYHLSDVEVEQLREISAVKCKPTTQPANFNCARFCLFDVLEDPCETKDVKDDHPEIVEALEELIARYRKEMRPQDRRPYDPCADPNNFNGFWMPWTTEESSPSNECQRLDYHFTS